MKSPHQPHEQGGGLVQDQWFLLLQTQTNIFLKNTNTIISKSILKIPAHMKGYVTKIHAIQVSGA